MPETILVFVTAVALEPLNDVTMRYSVSTVTLHVWENQKICCKPPASTAITQDEQLVLIAREAVRLGDEVMVPEVKDVVFANEGVDGEVTERSRLDVDPRDINSFAYLPAPPRLREGQGLRRVEREKTAPSCCDEEER